MADAFTLHFDDESGVLDIAKIVRENATPSTHLYCCGPIPMLHAFEAACADVVPEQVHIEYFKANDAPVTADGVELVLARSKKTVHVAAGKTVLDAVLEAGIDIPYSCMEGICGSCEVKVLEGIPDHHDSVLTAKQKASNTHDADLLLWREVVSPRVRPLRDHPYFLPLNKEK